MIAAVEENNPNTSELIFQSRKILRVVRHVRRFATNGATVLITGESGTGKEMIAQLLHSHSQRAEAPYVRVNCAALSESLVESELFGHERGAFTGATTARAGRFEHAQGGTLLLDEVSETPVSVQAKLLRVLESSEFQRVGSNRTLSADVRVIATSNRNLESDVVEGTFRSDLYYRLNILRVTLPPLRERPEDIPLLVTHFVNQFGVQDGTNVERVSARGMRLLCEYDWPGNVRQLRNTILRACLMAESNVLEPDNFEPLALAAPETPPEVTFENMRLDEIERHIILARLQQCNGNKTAAASALGVTPRTLSNKMNTYRSMGFIS